MILFSFYKNLNIGDKMDFNEIKELIKIFDDSSLSKIKIDQKGSSLVLEKGSCSQSVVSEVVAPAVQAPVAPKALAPKEQEVAKESEVSEDTFNSPMVGTFYIAPNPGAEHFIKNGQIIKKGQTLCILEAMKIMNEIDAEFDCKIVKILVEDGQAIEYDMPLFVIERI